jgi:erythritol kinase (D-erythritol 1-phosphate-forming)
MAWLCIDAGTSVIKAVLIGERGRELATARQSVPVERPCPDRAEQDMEMVWEAVLSVSRAVTRQSIAEVEGIVSTAQGDGCWLVDASGKPVCPAILWNDGRAHHIVEAWRADGTIEKAFRMSGSVTYPGLPNAIWCWLENQNPDFLKRARWSLTCNSWLHLRMTGQIATDLSDASNPFGDVVKRRYSPELLQLYGLEQQAHLLPGISRGQAPVGALLHHVAEALGVRPGLPVVMAPYDIVATSIGSGSVNAGEGCLILGTTICPEVITTNPGITGPPSGTTIALDTKDLYLRAMPTLTGCESLDWMAATLRTESLENLSRMAARSPVGANGVVCLPYFSPAGERSPFLAPSARASFLGLSLTHAQEDITRAAFEGLCFVIRECFSAASASPLASVRVCGGGSRSDLWCQMIADVCQCEALRSDASETGARGAFFYALTVMGKASSLQNAIQACAAGGQLYEPDQERVRAYDDLFQRFRKLREMVAPTWEISRGEGSSTNVKRT